ncbi:MAG: hypothetical protein F6K48_24980 [Okeania sp. SIO3H1]|uniref:hypothetical protein n=1 Tax=Okeania sp. SIO1I7 TaxID=2607772 RepID=UPI0013CB7A87|nr:hypothetical protein [Okeania sp. SIO1I7]NEN91981.1 hypothetical protein [Okeania sp. SIO3H1]NET27842.1 hypothetical protein [Okeania sp. SIO1I7]
MTANNLRQKILERLELLPGEQVKNLLRKWLVNSSGNLEYFEELLINESHQKTEELLDYAEIDSTLNFISLTEEEMVEQSKLALEDYGRQGVSVAHSRVREWADSL